MAACRPGYEVSWSMFERIRTVLMGEADAVDVASALRIAVAALLAGAARMDDRFTDTERNKISELLMRRFDLSSDEAERLVDAGERVERSSTGFHRFVHLLVEHMSVEQRIEIIEMLWE